MTFFGKSMASYILRRFEYTKLSRQMMVSQLGTTSDYICPQCDRTNVVIRSSNNCEYCLTYWIMES